MPSVYDGFSTEVDYFWQALSHFFSPSHFFSQALSHFFSPSHFFSQAPSHFCSQLPSHLPSHFFSQLPSPLQQAFSHCSTAFSSVVAAFLLPQEQIANANIAAKAAINILVFIRSYTLINDLFDSSRKDKHFHNILRKTTHISAHLAVRKLP